MDLPNSSSRRSFLGSAAAALAALSVPAALAAENAANAKATGSGKNNTKKAYIYAFHIGAIEAMVDQRRLGHLRQGRHQEDVAAGTAFRRCPRP